MMDINLAHMTLPPPKVLARQHQREREMSPPLRPLPHPSPMLAAASRSVAVSPVFVAAPAPAFPLRWGYENVPRAQRTVAAEASFMEGVAEGLLWS